MEFWKSKKETEKETVHSVVFFASFKSETANTDFIQRFYEEKTPSDLFDWIVKQKANLLEKHGKEYIVVNCKIIR